ALLDDVPRTDADTRHGSCGLTQYRNLHLHRLEHQQRRGRFHMDTELGLDRIDTGDHLGGDLLLHDVLLPVRRPGLPEEPTGAQRYRETLASAGAGQPGPAT